MNRYKLKQNSDAYTNICIHNDYHNVHPLTLHQPHPNYDTNPNQNPTHQSNYQYDHTTSQTEIPNPEEHTMQRPLIPKPKNVNIQKLHTDVRNFMHRMKTKYETTIKGKSTPKPHNPFKPKHFPKM